MTVFVGVFVMLHHPVICIFGHVSSPTFLTSDSTDL